MRAVVATLTNGSTARPEQLRGLSPEVVRRIEQDQAAPLAAAYREFLLLIGGGAGHFLQGSDVYHPSVLGLRTHARELLAENHSTLRLADTDRVFLMHQGYQFDFLRGTGPDPEVWSYCEGCHDEQAIPTHPRFTDWLRDHAASEIPVWARYEERVREGRRR